MKWEIENHGKYLKIMLSFRFVHVKIYWSICIKNFLTLFDSSVRDSHGTSAKIINDYEIRITRMIDIRHRWVYSSTYRMIFRELSNLKISEIKMFIESCLWYTKKITISTLSKNINPVLSILMYLASFHILVSASGAITRFEYTLSIMWVLNWKHWRKWANK